VQTRREGSGVRAERRKPDEVLQYQRGERNPGRVGREGPAGHGPACRKGDAMSRTVEEAFEEVEAVRKGIREALDVLKVADRLADDLPALLQAAAADAFHACTVTRQLAAIENLVSLFAPEGSACDVAALKPGIEGLRQALDKAYEASQTEGAPDNMDLAEALKRAEDPVAAVA